MLWVRPSDVKVVFYSLIQIKGFRGCKILFLNSCHVYVREGNKEGEGSPSSDVKGNGSHMVLLRWPAANFFHDPDHVVLLDK